MSIHANTDTSPLSECLCSPLTSTISKVILYCGRLIAPSYSKVSLVTVGFDMITL